MRKRGNSLGFTREPGAHVRIDCGAAAQNLDRHAAIETAVGGAKDRAHAAGAERALDLVRAECRGAKVGAVNSSAAAAHTG